MSKRQKPSLKLFSIFKNSAVFILLILSSLLSACGHLFYYPDDHTYADPDENRLQYEEIFFESKDGVKLNGWFFPAQTKKPLGTIVQFHGNGQNMSSHYASVIWLIYEGYNLFTFDYRGYRKSEGDPNAEGTYWDGLKALQVSFEKHKKTGAPRFIVMGESLGGAILARSVLDFEFKDKIDLLIFNSTFLSYKKIAKDKLSSSWLTWLFSPLGGVLVSDKYSAYERIDEIKTDALVIHDESDPVVSFEFGKYIYDHLGGKKEMWTYSNRSHVAFFSISEKNRNRFLNFLRK